MTPRKYHARNESSTCCGVDCLLSRADQLDRLEQQAAFVQPRGFTSGLRLVSAADDSLLSDVSCTSVSQEIQHSLCCLASGRVRDGPCAYDDPAPSPLWTGCIDGKQLSPYISSRHTPYTDAVCGLPRRISSTISSLLASPDSDRDGGTTEATLYELEKENKALMAAAEYAKVATPCAES